MKKFELVKEFVKRNKKKVIGGTVIVVGIIGGVLVVKYLSGAGADAVEEVIEVAIDGSEEALEAIEGITVTTF